MASGTRIFFAGIGTAFVIIAAGFGGGLMFAKTVLNEPSSKSRASLHRSEPVRVVLATTAEAAPAPQPAVIAEQTAPAPEIRVPEKQVEKINNKKADAEERARNKRYAERKAKRYAARMGIRQVAHSTPQSGILAFGGDDQRMGSFFGN